MRKEDGTDYNLGLQHEEKLFIMDNFFGRIKIVHMGFKAILRG
jgi:hypothetical protein